MEMICEQSLVVESDPWLTARKQGLYSSNHKVLDCGNHWNELGRGPKDAYENAAPTDILSFDM